VEVKAQMQKLKIRFSLQLTIDKSIVEPKAKIIVKLDQFYIIERTKRETLMSCMHSNIKGRQNTKGGNPRQKPILVKA